MIFRRKKPTTTAGGDQATMRGRDSVENRSNPLARRFHPDDEPETIDLQQPAGFNEEPGTAEIETSQAGPAPTVQEYQSVVTLVTETGKFYVQPGQGDNPVYLAGEPVTAPTELRRGDRIRIGGIELQILPSQE